MVYLEVHSSSIMSVLQSRPGSFLLLVKDLLEYQDYAPNGSIYGSKWNMFNHVHTGSGFMQVQFFFLLVAELGRSGTLDVDRVLTHCSTSSRTSRDSKMPASSSDSGGYGQITKSLFFWGGAILQLEEQLYAQHGWKSLDDVGKRHANRFLSDAYLKGVVRGQVECCNLRAYHRDRKFPWSCIC